MRKYLVFLLVFGIILLAGCELPVKKSASDFTNEITQDSFNELESEIEGSSSVLQEDTDISEVKGVTTEDNSKDKVEDKKLNIVLYYQSGDGYIIPTTRWVLKQEGIAKASVNALIDSSINREELEYFGLYPVLPVGTEVRGLTIKDGTATIDFNSKLLEYSDKAAERNIFTSIVYTLTEFKTIENVKILIDGAEKGKLKYGVDLTDKLSRNNILVNSESVNLKQGMKKADIFLLKNAESQYTYTLPVSIEYSGSTDDDFTARIIESLAKVTKLKELYSEIPQKTKLLSSNVDGSTLTLNFSSNIKDYGGGTAREEGLIKQILYSMKQVKGIEKVKILIDGKEDNLPEGTDISSEIDLPTEINDYIDKN